MSAVDVFGPCIICGMPGVRILGQQFSCSLHLPTGGWCEICGRFTTTRATAEWRCDDHNKFVPVKSDRPATPDDGWRPVLMPSDPRWPRKGHPRSFEPFIKCVDFLETKKGQTWSGHFVCASEEYARGTWSITGNGWDWNDVSEPKLPIIDEVRSFVAAQDIEMGKTVYPRVSMIEAPKPGDPGWPLRVPKRFTLAKWEVKMMRNDREVFNGDDFAGYRSAVATLEVFASFVDPESTLVIRGVGSAQYPCGEVEWTSFDSVVLSYDEQQMLLRRDVAFSR